MVRFLKNLQRGVADFEVAVILIAMVVDPSQ
jgi:hypothetical protein